MSFKDELRSLEPETHVNARKMLEALKHIIREKIRAGVAGEIAGSADLHVLSYLEYPIVTKKETTALPKKLFQRGTMYNVHLDISIKPIFLEAIPFLKQFAADDGITVSDPYFILHDIVSHSGEDLIFRESHILYEYTDCPGLDGWEQRVWSSAYIDYSITI